MPHPEQPSYEELAARNTELTARVSELLAVVAEQVALIQTLRTEVAVLRRQAGRDSSNSSQPPSQDSPAAEARAKAARQAARWARQARPQGGQKGHRGASLAWAARPDETRIVEPGTCGGCGADLTGATGRVACAVQVLDIPPAALTVTEYQMMSRTCGCGQVTTAPAPAGVTGGPVCYGPNVVAAATLLASTDVIGVERAADLMGALLKAPVSTGFGILDGYRGVLVRDDYGGYLSYDAGLAGVQQCLAHLYRYLDDAYAIDPVSQAWTRQAGDALRTAAAAVRAARDARQADLGPALLDQLRHSYDQAVACGISVNLSRPWHKGNHPGLVLARRLKRKAAQVWLFATRFDVPATNNGSENAVRGYKLAAKISGCWRTLSTLQRHCRIRSYLTTARSHGRHPLAAIRDALAGNTWMPPHPA